MRSSNTTLIAVYLVVVDISHVGIPELSGVPTMHAHEAADPSSNIPHKIAATDKHNIFLFSVATSDARF